jgi:hypothetical protein
MKKKNKRTRQKYPNLNPQYNLKTRQELIDYDYIDKLNDAEKAFLDKFTAEYTNASFEKEDPFKKGKRRKLKNLHKTKKLRKKAYDANNARNRDILTRAKAQGTAHYLDDVIKNEEDMHERLKQLFNSEDDNAD